MATPAERFKGWIEDLSESWKDRLRGWMASWLLKGIENTMDFFEPDLRAEVKPSLERIKEIEGLPDDLKNIIDKAIEEPKAVQFAAILPYLVGMLIGFGLGAATPISRISSYQVDKFIHSARLDPATITRIWLRDKVKYEELWQDLKDQGWNDEKIEVAKELAKIIPPLADMVRFADYSSFDPEVIEKWREFYDAPDWIAKPFALLGVTGEWANKYWFSHWRQPGRFELGELHRRLKIKDEDVKLAYRTMGYSPYWQEHLLDLVKAVPTRVDVRRWWDMQTINEERLREIYHAQGYYGIDLDDYVLWTKVYVAFPDLIARYKNAWITEDDVRNELASLGMPADRIDDLIETKIKKAATERVAKERDLTVTDIIKGVKKSVITRAEGQELLQDMGYDKEEAKFKLDINIPIEETITETKQRELTKTDILNAYKLNQIDEAEAVSRLMSIRYSEDDAIFLLLLTLATIEKIIAVKDRDLTKADIIKGVKNGVITQEEGYIMLLTIGYSSDESNFILSVNPITITGSPDTFGEFKAITQKYRASQGLSAKGITPDIIQAERDVKAAQAALKVGKDKKAKKTRIAELELALEQAKQRYHQLLKPTG